MRKYFFLIVSLIFSIALVSVPVEANAQSRDRSYIREQISYHGECRNVAITKRNGDLMLYGQNGWAATGCPKDLTEALHELNEEEVYIDDVQLTEDGRWLILYGNNGLRWNDIPYSLEQKLREWNSKQEVITSVSFNDAGNWIAVSTNYVCASDAKVQEWIREGMEDYGGVWATCVTEDAVVVVYETGFRCIGEVPAELKQKMTSTSINIYRLKIAGDAWFFSDGKSRYSYNM